MRDPHMKPATTPTARELLSEEQIARFLTLIAQGVGRHLAAQDIQQTGRLMRALARPERDPEFAAEYAAAVEEGRQFYADRLAAESRQQALSGNARMLEVELASNGPEQYAHLRRDRVKLNGTVQHEHALTVHIDAGVLDSWEPEKLEAFQAYLAELAGDVVDGEAVELPERASEAA